MDKYIPRGDFDKTLGASKAALDCFSQLEKAFADKTVFLGYDGYIDSLYRMVKQRHGLKEVEYYDSMKEFGEKIVGIAGSSGSIERILKKELAGGFAPNMARALANMAPQSTIKLYAAMGVPTMHPLFQKFPDNVNLHSVGNMGLTLAMEFKDGKIMSQDMEGINTLDWSSLLSHVGGRDAFIEVFESVSAIGNGHWSLMRHMNTYWAHMIEDIFPNVSNIEKKFFLVDPADMDFRAQKDQQEMLSLLSQIEDLTNVILSVNDREAISVSRALEDQGVTPIEKNNPASYEMAGAEINEVLNLSYFVIHDPRFATITGTKPSPFHYWVTEGYTKSPKFTTAAGDHFNAALLLSILGKLPPEEALVVANAATAIFVRTGESPRLQDLEKFIKNYMDYILQDIDTF